VAKVRLVDEERGLVGKLLVMWLLVFVLVVVAAIDGASILLARIHVADVAQTAADAGVVPLEAGRTREKILRAAVKAIAEADEDAQLERLETASGSITVEVSDRANTVLIGRFGLLGGLAEVSASRTARASG
jgi:Flp pilus assembly protein TadG